MPKTCSLNGTRTSCVWPDGSNKTPIDSKTGNPKEPQSPPLLGYFPDEIALMIFQFIGETGVEHLFHCREVNTNWRRLATDWSLWNRAATNTARALPERVRNGIPPGKLVNR